MNLFNDEFSGLPHNVQIALGKRLEEIIRMIYGRYNHASRDHSINNYSKEDISAMISSIFDLAQRLKVESEDELE